MAGKKTIQTKLIRSDDDEDDEGSSFFVSSSSAKPPPKKRARKANAAVVLVPVSSLSSIHSSANSRWPPPIHQWFFNSVTLKALTQDPRLEI